MSPTWLSLIVSSMSEMTESPQGRSTARGRKIAGDRRPAESPRMRASRRPHSAWSARLATSAAASRIVARKWPLGSDSPASYAFVPIRTRIFFPDSLSTRNSAAGGRGFPIPACRASDRGSCGQPTPAPRRNESFSGSWTTPWIGSVQVLPSALWCAEVEKNTTSSSRPMSEVLAGCPPPGVAASPGGLALCACRWPHPNTTANPSAAMNERVRHTERPSSGTVSVRIGALRIAIPLSTV